MHLQINKKIFIYFFLLILLGTFNNKNFQNIKFPKIKKIDVTGLYEDENLKLANSLNQFKSQSLFSIDKFKIEKILNSNNLIEQHSINKKYPSSLAIKIDRTKFLARIFKDGKNYYLGSNGKLIEYKKENRKLPFIFGEFKNEDFFDLFEIINDTQFNFSEIKNLFSFSSGRWDIETYSGILVKLPKVNLKQAFNLSLQIMNNKKFDNIKMIDIRQSNQVIING